MSIGPLSPCGWASRCIPSGAGNASAALNLGGRAMRRVTSHRMRGVLLVMLMTGPVTGLAAVVTARAAGAAVTQYSDPTISDPTSITVGPDGALWFTNSGNNTIGRVDDKRCRDQLRRPGHPQPDEHRRGARRRAVVHQQRQQFHRADQHRGGRQQVHRPDDRQAHRHHGRARRRDVVHQLQQLDRPDQHHRSDHQLHRSRASRTRPASLRARTARCGSPTTTTTRSAGSPRAAGSSRTTRPQRRSQQHRGRARRRALVHQPRQSHDRPDHHRRRRDATTRPPASRIRTASRPVRMVRCGSPTTATTRSGGYRPEAW